MAPAVTHNNLIVFLVFLLVAFLALPAASRPVKTSDEEDNCLYTIYVETGNGSDTDSTNAIISLTFSDQSTAGLSFTIPNLAQWGINGPDYSYFQKGNLDVFNVDGACLSGPPCWMLLASDNSGPYPSWYCKFVLVVTTAASATSQQLFDVDQWLSTDLGPIQLATTRDNCASGTPPAIPNKLLAAVVARDAVVGKQRSHGHPEPM